MKSRPMLFNSEMIRALLDGRKTQTRRPFPDWQKPEKTDLENEYQRYMSQAQRDRNWGFAFFGETEEKVMMQFNESPSLGPYGKAGDLIWVRETFRYFEPYNECDHMDFPCPCPRGGTPIFRASHDDCESKWTPSIHMPREASRLTLKIKNVRVERVQDISEEDAWAEGFEGFDDDVSGGKTGYAEFSETWRAIYGDSWEKNEWVWVYDFEVIQKNVDKIFNATELAA